MLQSLYVTYQIHLQVLEQQSTLHINEYNSIYRAMEPISFLIFCVGTEFLKIKTKYI